jgi:hypothetical protein
MKWRTQRAPAVEPVDHEPEGATLSDETRRAKEAAAQAGRQLAEVRARSGVAAKTGDAIEDLNRHNGFYQLIRAALGS